MIDRIWARTAIVAGWLALFAGAGIAHADAPVKVAAVPDTGATYNTTGDSFSHGFRLLAQGVDKVEVRKVRAVDCVDDHGAACDVQLTGSCVGGCTLTAEDQGDAVLTLTMPHPSRYTTSLEILYVTGQTVGADGKPVVTLASLSLPVTVTRATSPMGLVVMGPTGDDVAKGWSDADTRLQLRLRDEHGEARTIDAPIVATIGRVGAGNALVQTAAKVEVAFGDGKGTVAADGTPLIVKVHGLDEPGTYTGTLRFTAPGREAEETTFTLTVKERAWIAGLFIFLGAAIAYGARWWIDRGRTRLQQIAELGRRRDRLLAIAGGTDVGDRAHRVIAAQLDQLHDLAHAGGDISAALTRLDARVAQVEPLIAAEAIVAELPATARAAKRSVLDNAAAVLARAKDGDNLEQVANDLAQLASEQTLRDALCELHDAVEAEVTARRTLLPDDLRAKVVGEVDPALLAARTAIADDDLDALAATLTKARLAFAKILGESLRRLVTGVAAPGYDADAWTGFSTEVTGALARMDDMKDADDVAREYDRVFAKVASDLCAALAKAAQARALANPDEAARWNALAIQMTQAAAGPALAALASWLAARGDLADLRAGGAALRHTAALDGDGGPERPVGGRLPVLASTRAALAPIPPTRTAELGKWVGNLVTFLALSLTAILLGLKVLWSSSSTWGGWTDYELAFLWGAGLHAVGNETFKGLLGLKKDWASFG